MPKELMQQIADDLKESKKKAELTAGDVYHIVRDSVIRSTESLKQGSIDVKRVSRETIRTAIQTLVEGGRASQDKIAAAVNGAIDGIRHVEQRIVEAGEKELHEQAAKLQEEGDALVSTLREGLESVREVATLFSGQVRDDIEAAVADAKLQMTEMLGITRETVKVAVKKAIDSGGDVDETVRKITRDATARAVGEMRFTAERVRKVAEAVLSAAVEAASETGKRVREATNAAAEGVREGLGIVVEQTRESIAKGGKQASAYSAQEMTRLRTDIEAVGDLFVETLRKVADRSEAAAADVLHELAEDARKAGSSLRELATKAAQAVAKSLKELGSEAAETGERARHAVAQEVQELSSRMVAVAKGAAVGMWEGTRKALGQDDQKKGS